MGNDWLSIDEKPSLKSLSVEELGRRASLIRFAVVRTGWFILPIAFVVYLISPELTFEGNALFALLFSYLAFQSVLELLYWRREDVYNEPWFQMFRIQARVVLASFFVYLTGGSWSYFWFIYLWPLVGTTYYFGGVATWVIYAEVLVFYFASSLLVARGNLEQINFALLINNLIVLFMVTAISAYFLEGIRAAERKLQYTGILEQLLRIGQDMGRLALQEPKETLERIARSVCEEVDADCAVVYPYDSTREGYFDTPNVASYGFWRPLSLQDRPRTGGMAAQVRNVRIFEISDGSSQAHLGIRGHLVEREGIQAFAGVSLRTDGEFEGERTGCMAWLRRLIPLRTSGEEVGILYVNWRQPHQISKSERQVIFEHAKMAVQAILKGRRATGVQLAGLLGQIAQNAQRVLAADLVIIYPYRRGHERFVTPPVLAGDLNEPEEMIGRVNPDRVPALLVKRGNHYYADDVTTSEFLSEFGPGFTRREGIQSSAGVLLRDEDEIVGVMFVNYRTPWTFTETAKSEIGFFAGQAALAIRSARNFEQAHALREVQQSIAPLTSEPELVHNRILEQAFDLVGFSRGWISLLNAKTNTLEVKVARGLARDEWPSLERGKGISKHVAETGELMNVPDVSQEPLYEPLFEDTQSWLGMPLKYGDQVLGVLNLESTLRAAFTQRDQELIMALAGSAAVAVNNSRLYEQRVKDTLALSEINRAIVTKKPEEFELIADRATKITGADYCVIRLVDRSSHQLIARATCGPARRKDPLPIDDSSFTGWVASQERAQLCNDISRSQHYLPWDRKVKSCMAAPMIYEGQLIGTIYVDSTRLNAFFEAQLSLLESFADQAAIAIQNARLFDELQTLSQLGEDLSALEKEN